jgi:tetratricopeptide (TPR) repeat protein
VTRHDEGTGDPAARFALGPTGAVVLAVGLAWLSITPARAAPPAEDAPSEDAPGEDASSQAAPSEDAPSCDDPSGDACASPEPETAPETAIEWYAHGIELASAEDFTGAAEAFMRSYELQPTSEALFNAAYAYENAGAKIDAIRTYERFLAHPEPKQDRVPQAKRSIDALMAEVALLKGLRYDDERPPKELIVEGQPVELDAFPLLVMPGEIEIEVVDLEGERSREVYELAAGDALVVDLRALLAPPPEPPKPDVIVDEGPTEAELDAARRRARKARALRKVTWVGVGLTGATALGAVTFGLLALGERNHYGDDNCLEQVGGVCPNDKVIGDPEGHYNAYTRDVVAATALAGVSGCLAVATLVVGLVSRRYERPPRNPGGRASVRLRPGVGGLLLEF